jgi:hypothetical protein
MMIRPRRLLVAAAAVLAVGGGVAYATIPDGGNVYTACVLNRIGTMRLIDPSLPSSNLMSHCTALETQITWNQQGQPGKDGTPGPKGDAGSNGSNGSDGTSVKSASEPAGPNCAYGGVHLSGTNGDSYLCNGAPGPKGDAGTPGTIDLADATLAVTRVVPGDPDWSVGDHTIYADCGSGFAINAGFTNDTGSDNPAVITVVSAAGSEFFADRYTRVKVAFHWDRQPPPTGEIDASAECVPSSKPLP